MSTEVFFFTSRPPSLISNSIKFIDVHSGAGAGVGGGGWGVMFKKFGHKNVIKLERKGNP